MEETADSIDMPEAGAEGGRSAEARLAKTPLYSAYSAPRYQRQDLIRKIQGQTGRALVCYVAGARTSIHREDIPPFVDLLHNVNLRDDKNLDVLLHTGGGDTDAAEKLISLIRATVGAASLRVVVPDYAKSAGTLLSLGADEILMSDSSELGPIDPQVVLADANGNRLQHSVFAYLEAYERYSADLLTNGHDIRARIMLSKLEPQTVELFQRVFERTNTIAGNLLQRYMLKDEATWTTAQSELMNMDKWLSHGQPIMADDATEIGLKIDYREPGDAEWQLLWRLYCLQRCSITEKQKLFESEIVSLPLDSSAVYS